MAAQLYPAAGLATPLAAGSGGFYLGVSAALASSLYYTTLVLL